MGLFFLLPVGNIILPWYQIDTDINKQLYDIMWHVWMISHGILWYHMTCMMENNFCLIYFKSDKKNSYLLLFTQIKNQYFYFYHNTFFPLYSWKLKIFFSYISDDSRIYSVPFPVCVTIAYSFRYLRPILFCKFLFF